MSLFPYRQSFAGSTVPPDWKLYGSARMTGQGWLSLTQARTYQAGTALLATAFPSSDGISVEFDLAAHGGSSPVADGMSFFLIDGAYETGAGGPGGALGYACYQKGQAEQRPGVTKGYVGVGMDQYGSFSDPTQAGNGGPGPKPNNVVLRGSGDQYDGYRYLTGAALPTLSLSRENPTRVLLTVIDRVVTVSVRKDNSWQRLIDYDLRNATGQAALPATLKLGLSAATGMLTNNYEVRDLAVTLPAEMPLAMTGPQTLTAGSPIGYRITVSNKGPNAVPDAQVTGKIPTEVSGSAFGTIELTGGATAGTGTITNGTFTQPLVLPKGGGAIIPLNGTVNTGVVGDITCDATISSETRSNIATKFSDSVTTKVTAPLTADVPLGMQGPANADSGKPVSYWMTIQNNGPGAVDEAELTGTFASQLTGAVFGAPQLSGGAEAGQGTVSGGTFTQPLKLPKNGKAVIRLNGIIQQNWTGDLTVTSKIDTKKVTNSSPHTSGSVTTKVTPPETDVTIKEKTGFAQTWPPEASGYVWSFLFELAASANRIQQWRLTFDLAVPGRFNPQYSSWYTVVKDGSADGQVVIESPKTGHSIEPGTPLDVRAQILYPSQGESADGTLYNVRAYALQEGNS
ncbi:lectin-like domain-containing protein [Streptomyces abikoensis]|uniref:lectin-like domain-containing protein n=1 Tax=Streptomyces abikoensis TaxID=97398 RepID=UPI001678C726|nr:DUF11 domain-containing protein [Streptomyces abikoensis]GGP71055.1 hypothetical protein GCM10010214_52280 [Streptomyces abikoensis]